MMTTCMQLLPFFSQDPNDNPQGYIDIGTGRPGLLVSFWACHEVIFQVWQKLVRRTHQVHSLGRSVDGPVLQVQE